MHSPSRLHARTAQRRPEAGQQADGHADRHGPAGDLPVYGRLEQRQVEEAAVHLSDAISHGRPEDDADERSDDTDDQREAEVLRQDLPIGVAERLGQSDLAALTLDEARHGDAQRESADRKDEYGHDLGHGLVLLDLLAQPEVGGLVLLRRRAQHVVRRQHALHVGDDR